MITDRTADGAAPAIHIHQLKAPFVDTDKIAYEIILTETSGSSIWPAFRDSESRTHFHGHE
jgi:hypothetical protein